MAFFISSMSSVALSVETGSVNPCASSSTEREPPARNSQMRTCTSSSPGGKNPDTDWDLSMQRANGARRVLQDAGIDSDRFKQVSGRASSEPLYPDDPTLAGNRRIAIVLLREAPVLPPNS